MKIWWNPSAGAQHIDKADSARKRRQICGDIDARGFGWQVWFVASLGFFTDSYNLFATNVILPSLAYIYWTDEQSSKHETQINLVTLTGSIVGQLVFGFLSDLLGRRKLYGLELLFVIGGTLGLVQCSEGYGHSMSMVAWLIAWRFFVGIGIGAEYPLSAVITAEFAPAQSRARMLAALFSMQPLGQITAASVSLVTLVTLGRNRGLHLLSESEQDHEAAAAIVDRIWRIVIGVGAIPAFVAIIFRFTIPESPRFMLDVLHAGKEAVATTREYFGLPVMQMVLGVDEDVSDIEEDMEDPKQPSDSDQDHDPSQDLAQPTHPTHPTSLDGGGVTEIQRDTSLDVDRINGHESSHEASNVPTVFEHPSSQQPPGLNGVSRIDHKEEDIQVTTTAAILDDSAAEPSFLKQFNRKELHDYFIASGNWRYLCGTSLCWGTLDFAFYGLGIGNPRVIAQIWADSPVTNPREVPVWADPSNPDLSIYEILYRDGWHSIITVSIGSLLGSLMLIKMIDYIPRKATLAWSFFALMILFSAVGGSYFRAFHSDLHAVTITLYVLCQLVFNLGPNTLTFIIPAEIFPTKYRATCHGISAATGKLGSVIVQAFLPRIGIQKPDSKSLGWILIAFAFVMGLGAVFAWAWLPELQYSRATARRDDHEGLELDGNEAEAEADEESLDGITQRARVKGHKIPSKTLETLARGEGDKDAKERVGFRNRGKRLFRRLTKLE